jgi:hypothetical protein
VRRRQLLQLGWTSVAAAAAWSIPRWMTGPPSPDHLDAHPGLLDYLEDPEALRRIGLAYRAAFPWDDDVAVLRDALQHRATSPQDDFDHGRWLKVDGWILSRGEARQAALFSLLGA